MKFWSAASLEHEPAAIAADLRDQVKGEYAALDLRGVLLAHTHTTIHQNPQVPLPLVLMNMFSGTVANKYGRTSFDAHRRITDWHLAAIIADWN